MAPFSGKGSQSRQVGLFACFPFVTGVAVFAVIRQGTARRRRPVCFVLLVHGEKTTESQQKTQENIREFLLVCYTKGMDNNLLTPHKTKGATTL